MESQAVNGRPRYLWACPTLLDNWSASLRQPSYCDNNHATHSTPMSAALDTQDYLGIAPCVAGLLRVRQEVIMSEEEYGSPSQEELEHLIGYGEG